METINNGLERFHQEFPNVTFPTGEVTITEPANNASCTYHGQQVGTDVSQITASSFVEQLIVCGYIPRLNYGSFVANSTTEFIRNGAIEYRFALQNPYSQHLICGNGFAFMVPKVYSDDPPYNVGRRFCNPIQYGNDTYCSYCAGIDLNGNAVDSTYEN